MAEDDLPPPPDLPQPVLAPGAGLGTFIGGRPSDFLGMLGAFLGPLGRGPVSRSIGPFFNVLAQGWEDSDQRKRTQQIGQNLDAQYGGLDLPELQMARVLINQGDVPGGMKMLQAGITNGTRSSARIGSPSSRTRRPSRGGTRCSRSPSRGSRASRR
jgi:hypothetical protein